MVFALYFCPNYLLKPGTFFYLQKPPCINNFFIETRHSFNITIKEIPWKSSFWSMRLFCPLQIKVWALSWCWGDADLDGWLRSGSCEQVTAVSLWVQAAWCVNRTEEWMGSGKSQSRQCLGSGVWRLRDTHRPSSHPWLEQWQFLIRNGLHSPLTGGSPAAFSSLRAVLSFLHP